MFTPPESASLNVGSIFVLVLTFRGLLAPHFRPDYKGGTRWLHAGLLSPSFPRPGGHND